MKKAQFLVVAIVAALVVPIAFPVCLDYGKTQNDWSTVSSFTEAVASSPLPDLSESVAPSPPSAPADQTDNTTATVTSGGAVKASFTVVAAASQQPGGKQGRGGPGDAGQPGTHRQPSPPGIRRIDPELGAPHVHLLNGDRGHWCHCLSSWPCQKASPGVGGDQRFVLTASCL